VVIKAISFIISIAVGVTTTLNVDCCVRNVTKQYLSDY
jgi:hypothetical protein